MNFRPLKSPTQSPQDVAAVVNIYRQIFGNAPWNEGYRCPECQLVYSLTYPASTCDCEGQVLLVPFWPTGQVTSDFYAEMRKDGARCILAHAEEGVIGFAWGYYVQADSHLAKKIECPNLGDLLHGKYFYVDEVGLLLKYRGKGYGQKLHDYLVGSDERVLYRTLFDCTMYHIGIKRGYQNIAHISNQRVILARH